MRARCVSTCTVSSMTKLSFGGECSFFKSIYLRLASIDKLFQVFFLFFPAKRKDLALLYLSVPCSGQTTLHTEMQAR